MRVLKVFLIAAFSIVACFGAPVESAKSTIFILLGSAGGSVTNSSQMWESTGIRKFIQDNIAKEAIHLYVAEYDIAKMSPSVFVDEHLAGKAAAKSVLLQAQTDWFDKSQDSAIKSFRNLEDLRQSRPDLVPSRYILIAEGAAGLAVREYIQGENYKGEFSNVLFFNTPHEGTGFADQALFSQDQSAIRKSLDASSLEALIPLALAAYLVDGASGLREMMINLAKDAVMGMAYDATSINDILTEKGFFSNLGANVSSLWYMAQDADVQDPIYRKLIDPKGSNVTGQIGGTQLLNSFSKKNDFSHPNYNVVYSYGFPTIGNGRRTLDDFVDQKKVHVPDELVDNLLADEKLSGYLKGLSELRNAKLNKDDIAGSSMKILSIVQKFIPPEYKSELYSLFMDDFSPAVKSAAGSLKDGLRVVSSSLSSYSLNFFDEGVFDVPGYSAMASNVAAFREAGADRFGVDMDDFVTKNENLYKNLAEYRAMVADVGDFEANRKIVDVGLKVGCEATVLVGGELAVKACEAAEFAANVGMIAEMSTKIKKIVSKSGVLKDTKEIALKNSIQHMNKKEIYTHNSVKSNEYSYSDIEGMLFGVPQISLASVRLDSSGKELVVPEIFTETCLDGEVYDGTSMNSLCVDSLGKPAYVTSFPMENFDDVDFSSARAKNNTNIIIKNHGASGPSYAYYKTFPVTNYIREMRFYIDDLMPKELRWIRLDFNSRVQISYERISDTDWAVYFEKSYTPAEPVDTVSNLIDDRGLFVFRPELVLKKDSLKHPNDSYGLGGLQEDGVNIVYVTAMNKLGRTGSVQMPYFFRATDLNLGEGWPKSNEEVSYLKHVYAFMNNVGIPYNLVQAGLKVTRMDDKSNDSIAVTTRFLDAENGGKRWIVEANLEHGLPDMQFSDGRYLLDWEMMVEDTLNGGFSSFHLLTDVYVDGVAPALSLDLRKKNLTGNISDGRWADVVHVDSVGKWAVRAMRAFVVGPNRDTSFVLFKTNTAEYSYSLDWKMVDGRIAQGPSKLVVQAYDFANPDSSMKSKLSNIHEDSGKSSWQDVLDANGRFVSGINGDTLSEKIWIDRSAPEIVEGSLRMGVTSANPLEKRPDGSNLKKLSGLSLNANDTLKFSLALREPLLERDTTFVKLRVIFRDDSRDIERAYMDVVEYSKNHDVSNYNFEEPAANRLADGTYDVSIEAVDEAGNVLEKKIFGPVVVDRTPPSVYNMGSGNLVPTSVAELKDLSASVSQVMDVPANVGMIDCFKRLDAAGQLSDWTHVDAKGGGYIAVEKEYEFSVKDIAPSGRKGTWAVYLKCYDAAGNSSSGTDFFDMGLRSPEIVYPDDSINSLYYGKILIKGIAPNPVVKGGNDNAAKYRLDWRKIGDTDWSKSGIEEMSSGVSLSSRALAVWDVSALEGDYELRLSVRGCDDESVCPWVSTERIVSIYDTREDSFADTPPDIVIEPSSLVPGDGGKIAVHLEHVSDTSKWAVEAKLLVQSPRNPDIMAEAQKWTADPAMVSPFAGKPQNFKEGLNIWQENRSWNIVWVGAATGASDSSGIRVQPSIRLKYVDSNVVLDKVTDPVDRSDSLKYVGAIELQGIYIPAYDRVSQWTIHGDMHFISFETDSAFILDVSSVDKDERPIYCGASGRPLGEVMPEAQATGVMYVNPENFLMHFTWNGLVGGTVPSGENAVLSVVAYNKADMSQVIIKEQPWLLSFNDTKIVLSSNQSQVMVVGPSDDGNASSYAREKLGLAFGLKGRSAYVTVDILNPKGDVVKNLMKGEELLLAGVTDDAYELSWGGISDNSFASTEFGEYKVRIVARDENGLVLDSVEYGFEVRGATSMIDVATLGDSVMKGDYPPILEIDETELDANNELRFVGRADYLMKMSASGNALPEKDRIFYYKWEWDPSEPLPLQAPALWKKNKFSMGIHRHRDEFPVTVVTMLITKGADVRCEGGPNGTGCSCWNEIGTEKYVYQINVYDATFRKGENWSQYIKMNPNTDIVGKLIGENNLIGFALKVFPRSLSSQIISLLGSKNVVGNADNNISWSGIWEKDKHASLSRIWHFLNNFNSLPYWEAYLDNFYADGKNNVSMYNKTLLTAGCTVDTTKDASGENFVCGPKTAEDEINKDSLLAYNPHSNMLNAYIAPSGEYGYFDHSNKESRGCNPWDDHAEDITLVVRLSVDSSYWNPQWGYNNLANRYVRFDPTNKTLYDKEGYFGHLPIWEYNFYSGVGWIHAYERDSAFVTALEAQRYMMRRTGMNPLLFNDELDVGENSGAKDYPSTFDWNYFTASDDIEWIAVAEGTRADGLPFRSSYNSKEPVPKKTISNVPIKPLDITFTIAPVMTAKEAFVQDVNNYGVDYPYKGTPEELSMPAFEGASKYKLYKGLASRVHYGVNDWDDISWDTVFTINGVVQNPLTDASAIGGNPMTVSSLASYKDALDKIYRYDLDGSEWSTLGYWAVPYDSLEHLVLDNMEYGNSHSIPNTKATLKLMDQDGNPDKSWHSDDSQSNAINNGIQVFSHPEYVFLRDSIEMDPNDRSHKVALASVIGQNVGDSVIGSPWVRGISIAVDSLCYRDSTNKKHAFFTASYNPNEESFNVHRSGSAPNERIPEIATIRGRVPEDSMRWNLQYTKDGVLYPLASGVQDTVPLDRPFPVFNYFDMNKLQGNTTLFLSYGGEKGFDFYKTLNLHVGTLVPPDSSMTVTSMYGNVSVAFNAGAWGDNPVDVTVRSVSPSEYVFTVFKDLAVAGPVVEVLPSHKFSDSDDMKPVVTITLTRADVYDNGFDPYNLKIYKPDFEVGELKPLETTIVGFWDKDSALMQPEDVTDANWSYVKLKAMTSSFSSFLVTDSASVAALPVYDITDTVHFVCDGEMSMDTLWAGTVNGWLGYPYPCRGKGNYVLQLRSDGRVAAEYRGVAAGDIAWALRKSDFYVSADIYESRATFYGTDGSSEQQRGPYVRVDSVVPSVDEIEMDVTEDGGGRRIVASALLSDIGSGISKAVFELYFGGTLLARDSVTDASSVAREFVIDGKTLYGCVGCRATVNVIVEDRGHNASKKTVVSDKLYPYPSSLVLWYPLQEGFGAVAHELTGSALDLDISGLYAPWGGERGLVVRRPMTSAASISALPQDAAKPFSVEMRLNSGYKNGTVLTWDGPYGWSIGTEDDGRFYIDYGNARKVFNLGKSLNAFVHFVWVFEDRKVTLYKDGSPVETVYLDNALKWRGSGRPVLGKFGERTSAYFAMMDLRIYKSALTEEQVMALYNGDLDVDGGQIYTVRATDLVYHDGLVMEQSCAVAGKSYLRQGLSSSDGVVDWTVDTDADTYALYLLARGYAGDDSRVEVVVNGINKGAYKISSTGYWESERVGTLTLQLSVGSNTVSLRPLGNVGIAGLALVPSSMDIPADRVDYGESGWESPAPRVAVEMRYSPTDGKTANPVFRVQNLTPKALDGTRLRYYFKGEGESVQAVSYYPYRMMSVSPDAGEVYYAELTIPDAIAGYDWAYYGGGPQLGFNRIPNYQLWNIYDDPSYVAGAERNYVKATGVALLDAEGSLLNDWACYDADGAAVKPKKAARVLVADETYGNSQSSTISMVVENTGSVPIDGFESRFYFRDAGGNQSVDAYSNMFAEFEVVHAGGDLYYVSFVYPDVILNPGEKSDYGDGVKFAMYNSVNRDDYDVYDDPSYSGISTMREFVVADSAIVLDLYGNLLWGDAPCPKFSNGYVIEENRRNLVYREGDVVYVTIEEEGHYVLEIVDAAGMPLRTLFNGTWSEGEHSLTLIGRNMNPGNYLVLRRDNVILSWQILK